MADSKENYKFDLIVKGLTEARKFFPEFSSTQRQFLCFRGKKIFVVRNGFNVWLRKIYAILRSSRRTILRKKNQIFDFLVIHSTYIILFINISLEILFNLGCMYLIAEKFMRYYVPAEEQYSEKKTRYLISWSFIAHTLYFSLIFP